MRLLLAFLRSPFRSGARIHALLAPCIEGEDGELPRRGRRRRGIPARFRALWSVVVCLSGVGAVVSPVQGRIPEGSRRHGLVVRPRHVRPRRVVDPGQRAPVRCALLRVFSQRNCAVRRRYGALPGAGGMSCTRPAGRRGDRPGRGAGARAVGARGVVAGFPVYWIPWLAAGYSQIDTPLAGIAPILGVYGCSAAIAVSSGVVAIVPAVERRTGAMLGVSLLVLFGGAAVLQHRDWTAPAGEPLTAVLVQGAIPQAIKWRGEQRQPSLDLYQALSAPHWGVDIMIWPKLRSLLFPSRSPRSSKRCTDRPCVAGPIC